MLVCCRVEDGRNAGRSVQRFNQRQGFLVSAILHLTLLMILISHPPTARKPDEIDLAALERKDVVFLPPAAVLRQMRPAAAGRRPRPVPRPDAAAGPGRRTRRQGPDQRRAALRRPARRGR